jgi:homoserine dehydrogenase
MDGRQVTPRARPLRVSLLGLGTVGGAVAKRLLDRRWREDVATRGIAPPELVAVGVREPARSRPVSPLVSVELTDDLEAVVGRDDVDVVIELLGGLEPARALTEQALERGIGVVTANKMLLAELGPALERAARRSGAALRFEAAVAGGTPVLGPLARELAANRIEGVRGIVNGTTNFILSAMAAEGRTYDDVLADAQQRGFAEADPSTDVAGLDAAHKLVLLARLAFGVWVQPSGITRSPPALSGEGPPGITGVTASEVAAATDNDLAIKLVASAARVSTKAGSRLVGSVEPVAVGRSSSLGSTSGATNVVEVSGVPVGRVSLQGPGAGGDATSSAVLADLLALARGEGSTWAALPEALPLTEIDAGRAIPSRWFFVTPETGARISDQLELDALRGQLREADVPPTTLYRVIEDG